jgi:uncharacterized protein YgiM (DUF1202 family)
MTTPRRQATWKEAKVVRLITIFILLVALAAGVAPGSPNHVRAASFAVGDTTVVDTDYLNLRADAGLSASVLDVLPGGTTLTVTSGSTAADGYYWYQVRTSDGATGWVAGSFLAFGTSGGSFAAGDFALVDVSNLNCRSGPGLDYGVLYIMSSGSGAQILDGPQVADGYHWYKVRTDAEVVGWVIGEALVPATGDPGAEFGSGQQVVVNTDFLNLRSGAGLDEDVLDVLLDGTALIVSNGPIAADSYDWYEVETRDGQSGWVAGTYLAAAPGLGFAVGDALLVANGSQNLREGPGLDAGVVRVMADGEVLLVQGGPIEQDGYTWYHVWNYAGEGWAAGEFLRFEPDGFPQEDGG